MLSKEKIIDKLKKIKDPESELSIYELKMIRYVDYEKKDKKLLIALDFNRRMPSCIGCKPIAWMIQKKIVKELGKEFSMFKEVKDIEFRYT